MDPLVLELQRDADAPARAREAVRRLEPLLGERGTDDATLLVSELVTNAVMHGSGPIELRFAAQDRRARFEISDAGGGATPALREAGGALPGGFGLHLVDRIAERWGVRRASMHVWFELGL